MRIRVVFPIIGNALLGLVQQESEAWASSGTTVEVVGLTRGCASIESEYDEALSAPGILDRVAEAGQDGVDGVFISCFGDPAVHAAREIVDVPVMGGYEPAMLTAMSLGERVGIVTVLPNVVPMLRSLAHRYAIADRLGTVRVVDVPVLAAEDDKDLLLSRLLEESADAVESGEADVIVLGCTGMLGVAATLQRRLADKGLAVPVVDPTGAGIAWVEKLVRLGVSSSRTTYLPPPPKERNIA